MVNCERMLTFMSVAIPGAGYFLARERVETMFGHWKNWLIKNNPVVVMVLLLVFDSLLIVGGMKIISA
jgi:hypothetical protein